MYLGVMLKQIREEEACLVGVIPIFCMGVYCQNTTASRSWPAVPLYMLATLSR